MSNAVRFYNHGIVRNIDKGKPHISQVCITVDGSDPITVTKQIDFSVTGNIYSYFSNNVEIRGNIEEVSPELCC